MSQIKNAKIAITGPASQVGLPVARALAKDNHVIGAARFSNPADRKRLEDLGVECVKIDLASGEVDAIPEDIDYVMHFAVAKSPDFAADLRTNAEGLGHLMSRCRGAKAFLVCSTTGVYKPNEHEPLKETGFLGDSHVRMLPTYSISKIAAEAVAGFAAKQWQLPTTIARLNVPFGNEGGWPLFHLMMMQAGQAIPVHENAPSSFNPIHEDDIVRMVPRLLQVAATPATIVNWGGIETTSIEEWCRYMGELTGLEAKFIPTTETIESIIPDTTKMVELIGATEVDWRDGLRRMIEARMPELLKSAP
ncbi:MAG: NAD(P)-dependent oxidoreductase [Deltaproteobacteria bacterium]